MKYYTSSSIINLSSHNIFDEFVREVWGNLMNKKSGILLFLGSQFSSAIRTFNFILLYNETTIWAGARLGSSKGGATCDTSGFADRIRNTTIFACQPAKPF